MGQPDQVLSRNKSFFSRLQIALDGVIQTGRTECCCSVDAGTIAFVEQQKQQLEPARDAQFLKSRKRSYLTVCSLRFSSSAICLLLCRSATSSSRLESSLTL